MKSDFEFIYKIVNNLRMKKAFSILYTTWTPYAEFT